MQALKQLVGTGIHRLFHAHLQNLRDHFGSCYEAELGKCSLSNENGVQRQKAAKRAEEGFMKAAFGSIPEICQHPNGELCVEYAPMFSCVGSLRGLLEDMYEVTTARGLEEEEWEDVMGMSVEGSDDADTQTNVPSHNRVGLRQLIKKIKGKLQKRGPAKWYERLAAKIFVIGVNYIQGWIILQTLRREARRRDLAMPKFPLF